MFAKLLKYEWKSTSSVLGILSLCVLGAGVLGGGAIRFMAYCTEKVELGIDQFVIPLILMILLLTGSVLAIIAYALGSQIMLYVRFYKSRFTDEGYLTFTLPVSAAQIFWSSFLVIVGWMLINAILVTVSVFLLLFVGTLGTEAQMTFQDARDMAEGFSYAFRNVSFEAGITIAVSIISAIASVVYCMTAVTVGSVIARKHKLLAAIGVYLGANMVMSMITGTFSAFAMILSLDAMESAINFIYIAELIFSLAFASGACVLDIYLMKNKLNLP